MKIRRGPATVTGDDGRCCHCLDVRGGKVRPEDDPEARRLARGRAFSFFVGERLWQASGHFGRAGSCITAADLFTEVGVFLLPPP